MITTAAHLPPRDPLATPAGQIEVSIVIPCLNEADTLQNCIRKAQAALRDDNINGEIIVADNGSADGSPRIAEAAGARVVHVVERGYGSALMGGIAAAAGRFIVIGDADDSYDFREVPRIVAKLREGFDLVQGCRLPSGGGTIMGGAMPPLHRWWGNPMFSFLARRWFGAPVHDIYCGMRGFTRDLYQRLDQRCTGMEFATEMIIKASLAREKITEVPITLYPDGRRAHAPHLKTFRDGWLTMRFFLMFCPRWLFVAPGSALILLGLIGYALALPGFRIGRANFDAHTLLFSTVAILCGYQTILFGIFTKTFAIGERLLRDDPVFERWVNAIFLQRGLLLGGGLMLAGLALLGAAVIRWIHVDFGHLDYARTMRIVVPGAALTAVGFQTILANFFIDILRLKRH